jgi:hypothetical protein
VVVQKFQMAARGQQPLFLLLAVLLLGSSHSVLAQRSLLQSEAVSNSNGCLGVIPKCEAGACAARNIMGAARWVCLRCLANYEPVVDNSGQDNIIQCGRCNYDRGLTQRQLAANFSGSLAASVAEAVAATGPVRCSPAADATKACRLQQRTQSCPS